MHLSKVKSGHFLVISCISIWEHWVMKSKCEVEFQIKQLTQEISVICCEFWFISIGYRRSLTWCRWSTIFSFKFPAQIIRYISNIKIQEIQEMNRLHYRKIHWSPLEKEMKLHRNYTEMKFKNIIREEFVVPSINELRYWNNRLLFYQLEVVLLLYANESYLSLSTIRSFSCCW